MYLFHAFLFAFIAANESGVIHGHDAFFNVPHCTRGMMASFTDKRLFPAVRVHMHAQHTTLSAALIAIVTYVGPQVRVDS